MKTFKKILLIDDDELTNLLNKKTIKKTGFAEHIDVVLNGQEGLDYLSSNKASMPDLIFLDINMPVMNGFEFLEAYRQQFPKKKDTIVLMMLTTSLNKDSQQKVKDMEVAEFISKPLTVKKLELIREKYLE